MRRRIALALMLVVSSSCVMTKEEGDTLKRDVDQLKTEVSALQRQQKDDLADQEARLVEMQRRVDALEATLTGLRQADADNGVQMEKVIAELQILRGDIEEARYALNETKDQLGETKKSVQDILDRPPIEVQAAARAPLVEAPKQKTIGGVEIPAGKQELYDLGKKFFDDGKNAEAIEALTLFTNVHKDDRDLLDNAYFWLGEAHYTAAQKAKEKTAQQASYKSAILAYQKVMEQKDSNKIDGALFKLGLSFEGAGYEDANVFYEELVARYPKSSLVGDAKKRLQALEKAKKEKGKRKGR